MKQRRLRRRELNLSGTSLIHLTPLQQNYGWAGEAKLKRHRNGQFHKPKLQSERLLAQWDCRVRTRVYRCRFCGLEDPDAGDARWGVREEIDILLASNVMLNEVSRSRRGLSKGGDGLDETETFDDGVEGDEDDDEGVEDDDGGIEDDDDGLEAGLESAEDGDNEEGEIEGCEDTFRRTRQLVGWLENAQEDGPSSELWRDDDGMAIELEATLYLTGDMDLG
ncbi:hypothetical protein JAAARDRAFT_580582 [Jaapia argillacea MUCL 33604]|uniref:Uncharacterized protein n=1 Tax=Jaapia argillacea MUCL 33604 TaxID=933084 RepID=A0A067P748_9AGAM|nr:hypothetical protein JAAARDRAFT_580582 [Jaapia argillacea MUCL 33604]